MSMAMIRAALAFTAPITAQYTTATDNDAAEPIYNRLAEFEKGGTAAIPALATSWDVSEDGQKISKGTT